MSSVLYFLVLVGILVVVHEFGHFVAAKLLDFKVDTFSLGFGRPLLRVRLGETDYQVGVFPFGGFVRIAGENPDDDDAGDQSRAFGRKPLWRRLVVVFAGPAANLVLPVVIYFALFVNHSELPAATVGDVLPESPAEKAGLRAGDSVISIDGVRTRYWQEIENAVRDKPADEIKIKVGRSGRTLEKYVLLGSSAPGTGDTGGIGGGARGVLGITRAPFPAQVAVQGPRTPAAASDLVRGDLVFAIDGVSVSNWRSLELTLDRSLRKYRGRANVAVGRGTQILPGIELLAPHRTEVFAMAEYAKNKARTEVGLVPAELVITEVEEGTMASDAGLRPGDLLVSLDGAPLRHWTLFERAMARNPTDTKKLEWARTSASGTTVMSADVSLRPREVVDDFGHRRTLLDFGARPQFALGSGKTVPIHNRLSYAASRAAERTSETVEVMASGFLSILAGQSPGQDLGGPIAMYRAASVSGERGWQAFLLLIALISVSVGLINLLPIPVLDGGHLVFFAVEAMRRKQLTAQQRSRITVAGYAVVGLITVLALRNDVVRFLLP